MQKFHSRLRFLFGPVFLFAQRLEGDIDSRSERRFLLFSDLLLHSQLLFPFQFLDHLRRHRSRVDVDAPAVGLGLEIEVVVLPVQLLLLDFFLLDVEFHPHFELLLRRVSPALREQLAHFFLLFEPPASLLVVGEQVEVLHRVPAGALEGLGSPVNFLV